MSRPDAKKWEAALIKEYKQIARKNTWKTVRKTEVPKGQKILSGRLVFRTKRDKEGNILKYKVRWVVQGYEQQYGKDYDQTFASVCKSASWKTILAIAALYDLEIEQMDAVVAFLNSEIDSDVYMKLLPDWHTNTKSLIPDKDHE